jgi:acetyl esterase/lipase
MKAMRYLSATAVSAALLLAFGPAASVRAQVTPDMKARIAAIGRVVDPPSSAQLYAPLQAQPPYPGVTVTRDVAYGPDARNILDVFQPDHGDGLRPVLIFVAGGPGNKKEDVPEGGFYDNIMLWAVKNGMVGVNVQRHPEFAPWEAGAHDLTRAIDWVHENIAQRGGDPNRVFIWGHSAGAAVLAHYLAHPDLYPAGGVGVKAAILMAAPYNLAPLQGAAPPLVIRMGMQGAPGHMPPDTNPAATLAASDLTGLRALKLPLFVGVTQLDPEMLVESAQMLRKQLCDAGHCPKFVIFKDHGHMTALFAVGTADVSTSKPVLDWIRSIDR